MSGSENIKESASVNDVEAQVSGGALNENLRYMLDALSAQDKPKRQYGVVLAAIASMVVAVMVNLLFSMYLVEGGKYINKTDLQSTLSAVISNGGGLDVIRHAVIVSPSASQAQLILSSADRYYPPGTPLSLVLDDLRLNAYAKGDKTILPELIELIEEYEAVNPFDSLPAGQKDRFENVRVKSGDAYSNISADVNSIAEELSQKNLLVGDYLADSKMSFWISILAVFISVLIGGYQIFSARQEAMTSMFVRALTKSEHKNAVKTGSPTKE